MTHIQSFYLLRIPTDISRSGLGGFLQYVISNGGVGVLLFFAISGFILMLPFARYNLFQKEKPSLKKYYMRRLIRLEPPYFVTMIFLFAMKIIVQKRSFSELLPHLGASLVYMHQFIYNEMSRITPIAWSLEVEIQFYLLAPFLAVIYRAPKAVRRIIMLCLITVLPIVQHLFGISEFTFLGSMQYFLVGFILLDLYLCGDKIAIDKRFIKPVGALLLLFLISVSTASPVGKILYPFMILIFYQMVLNTEFWNTLFQNKFLTCVGGMCYSIYLLHFAIISFVSEKSLSFKVSDLYLANIFLQSIIQLPIVLLVCAVFYLLVEKPCMNPRWPKKILELISIKYKSNLSAGRKG